MRLTCRTSYCIKEPCRTSSTQRPQDLERDCDELGLATTYFASALLVSTVRRHL